MTFRLTKAIFDELVERLRIAGFADADIEWSENIKAPDNADDFALEIIFVICNSGMQNRVARKIFDRILEALRVGRPVGEVFGHKGKVSAINHIWANRVDLLAQFHRAADKLEWCGELPWVGNITKYHAAKNLGADVAKPDVHLQRLADLEGTPVADLCRRLADESGYRVATVDLILWRACAEKIMDSHTGLLAKV